MAKVEWIRLSTDIFSNPKIKYIRSLPEGNNMILIWVMLLTKAGICNEHGYIMLTENIPYTPDMLGEELGFSETLVKLALGTFEKLGMVSLDDSEIFILGWEDHQNADGLERIKAKNRERQANFRNRKKMLEIGLKSECVTSDVTNNVINNVMSHQNNAIEEDKEEDKDINNKVSKDTYSDDKSPHIDYKAIIDAWNDLGLSRVTKIATSTSRQRMLKCRIKEHGQESIIKAIEHIKNSSFLKGQNSRGWIVTFDWFIKPDNFVKVLEGNYSSNKPLQITNNLEQKKNKFTNIATHNWDFDEIQRLEREYVQRKIAEGGA